MQAVAHAKNVIEALGQLKNSEADAERILGNDTIEILGKGLELHSNEASNKELIDWKRVRSIIEHENILINQRLTWLFTSQGALFLLFGSQYVSHINKKESMSILLAMIGSIILGILISYSIYMNIRNADYQISRATRWWYRRAFKIRNDVSEELNTLRKGAISDMHQMHPPVAFSRKVEEIFEDDYVRRNLERSFLATKLRKWILKFRFVLRVSRIQNVPVFFLLAWLCIAIGLGIREFKFWIFVRPYFIKYGIEYGISGALIILLLMSLSILFRSDYLEEDDENH